MWREQILYSPHCVFPNTISALRYGSVRALVFVLFISLIIPRPVLADEPTIPNANLFTYESTKARVEKNTGALTQNIPLDLPPGRNGLQPSIALQYNSQSAQDSIVGFGWSLSIPSIERFNKTGSERLYIDNVFRSSLGGELATTSATTYRHKVDDGQFTTYTFSNNSWIAYDKQGLRYTFGSTTQARQFDAATSSNVVRWMIEEIRDTNDNYIEFTYQKNSNELYPTLISYTGTGSTDGPLTVTFATSTRPDPYVRYVGGVKITTNHRISEIKALVNNSWVRKYTLSYESGNNGVRSLLASVQLTGKDENSTELSLPATTFDYMSSSTPFVRTGTPSINNPSYVVSDVNGNGRNDTTVLYYDNSDAHRHGYIKYDDGSVSTFLDPPQNWADLVASQYVPHEGGTRLFDVNGDGWADIVQAAYEAGNDEKFLYISSTTTPHTWTSVASSSWSGSIPAFKYDNVTTGVLAEINGDGITDYVARLVTVSATAHIGNGLGWNATTSIFEPVYQFDGSTSKHNQLIDINGDGLDDWAYTAASSTYVRLNTGTGWEASPDSRWTLATSTLYFTGSDPAYWDRGIRFLDINGDGLVDFVRSYKMPSYSGGTAPAIEVSEAKFALLNTGSGWATTTMAMPSGYITEGSLSGSNWNGDLQYNEYVNWDGKGQKKQDVLIRVQNSTGGITNIDYVETAGDISHSMPISLLVVSSTTVSDNFGNNQNTTYEYDGGEMYLTSGIRERQFAGFSMITESTALGTKKTYYHQGNAASTSTGELVDHRSLIGKSFREEVIGNATSSPLKRTFTKWGVTDIGTNTSTTTSTNSYSVDLEGSSSQYASIADASQTGLDFSDLLTFALWANFESTTSNPFIFKRHPAGNERSFSLDYNNSSPNVLTFTSYTNGSTIGCNVAVSWTPSTSTWYHVALTKSGTSVKFYVNGSQQGSTQTCSSATIHGGTAAFEVGGFSSDSLYFDGKLDDVRVWSRQLSSTEVSNLYSSPASFSNGSSTQGLWSFNGGYTDTSGNNNTLTGQNSPVFSTSVPWGVVSTSTSVIANAWFTSLDRETVQDWEAGSTHKDKASEYTYATTTGNLTRLLELGEVTSAVDGTYSDIGTDSRTTDFTYATSSNNLSVVTSKLIKNFASTTIQESRFYYDNQAFGSTTKGNRTKDEQWIAGSTYASSTKSYNSYGLVATSTDPRGATTTFAYDSFNLYAATTTNALGHVTGILYDYATGKPKRIVDPNNLVRTTTFDPVGRVSEEKQPDITTPSTLVTSKQYTYTDTFPTSIQTTSYFTSSTSSNAYIYRDGLGRTIQERVQVGTSTYSVKDYIYTSSGLFTQESLPYFATSSARSAATTTSTLFTTQSFDALKRATSTVNAVGSTVYTFSPWKTRVTDANGNPKDLSRDAFGNLTSVVEYNDTEIATTTYAYDALGNLATTTDALANIRKFTYDGLSRRLTAQDLHDASDGTFGTWNFAYDRAGNIASSTDPKSQVVSYTFDSLNRVTAEDYTGQPGTEVSYLYDFCTYGKGKLCVASSTEAKTSTAYNALGLVSGEALRINGVAYATTSFAYDRQGNQTLVTYPDGREVAYGYDQGGRIADIKTRPSAGTFSNVLSRAEYAPHGQITRRTYGNSIDIPYSYYTNALYRLERIGAVGSSTGSSAGYSLDLERSSSQYASISDASQTGLDVSNDLTFSTWVKFETDPSGSTTAFIGKRVAAGSQRSYLFYYDGTNLNLEWNSDGSAGTGVSVAWNPADSTWYHVAVTKSGTSVKFYVDGAQQGTTQTGSFSTIYSSSTAPVEVGTWTNGGVESGFYLDGLMDDVRMWSRELSSSEITSLYSSPNTFTNGSSLGGNWQFENAYTDASGNGNTLTAQNSPVFSSDARPGSSGQFTYGIQSIAYTYDSVGNILSIVDNSSTTASKTVEYTYDDLYRLLTASTTAASSTPFREVYRYNVLGNMMYKGNGAATSSANTNTHSLDLESSSNQYASIADASQTGLDLMGDLTLSGWFNMENVGVVYQMLIFKRVGAGNERSYSWYWDGNNPKSLRLESYTDGSTLGCNVSVTWTPSVSTWYHLTLTKSGTSVKFYVDGAQQGTTQTCSNATIHGGTAPFEIGAFASDGGYYDGKLDDVRVWSRELSSTEVSDLYTAPGSFNNGSSLEGNWQFDSAYTDASGNSNTLVAQNSPVFVSDVPYVAGGSLVPAPDTYVYSETNYANPHAVTGIWLGYATSTLVYDNNGNVTQYGTTTAYIYDYRNRMSASGILGATTTYGYDHTQQRMRQTLSNGTRTHYPNKFYSIVSSVSGATTTATSTAYIWQGDTLVGYIEQRLINGTASGTPTTYYVHPDHLGSTNVVTNASGTPIQTLDYYPYGSERIHSGSADSARTFIGQFGDDASSLSYLNARYYDGSRGQFLSEDPVFWELGITRDGMAVLTNPQTLNSYAYANGNPISNKDPNGRCAGPLVVICGGALVGAVGGVGFQALNDYQTGEFGGRTWQENLQTYGVAGLQGATVGAGVATAGLVAPAAGLGAGATAIAVGGTSGALTFGTTYGGNYLLGKQTDAGSAFLGAGISAVTAGTLKTFPQVTGRLPNFGTQAFYMGKHTQRQAAEELFHSSVNTFAQTVNRFTSQNYSGGVSSGRGGGSSGLVQQLQSLVSALQGLVSSLSSKSNR